MYSWTYAGTRANSASSRTTPMWAMQLKARWRLVDIGRAALLRMSQFAHHDLIDLSPRFVAACRLIHPDPTGHQIALI